MGVETNLQHKLCPTPLLIRPFNLGRRNRSNSSMRMIMLPEQQQQNQRQVQEQVDGSIDSSLENTSTVEVDRDLRKEKGEPNGLEDINTVSNTYDDTAYDLDPWDSSNEGAGIDEDVKSKIDQRGSAFKAPDRKGKGEVNDTAYDLDPWDSSNEGAGIDEDVKSKIDQRGSAFKAPDRKGKGEVNDTAYDLDPWDCSNEGAGIDADVKPKFGQKGSTFQAPDRKGKGEVNDSAYDLDPWDFSHEGAVIDTDFNSEIDESEFQAPGRKQTIRFSQDQLTVVIGYTIGLHEYTDEEIAQCWWTKEESLKIKRSAQRIGECQDEKLRELIGCVKQTYAGIQYVVNNAADLDQDCEELLQNPGGYTDRLERWTRKVMGQRGLETQISDSLLELRCATIKRAQRGVVKRFHRLQSCDEIADYYRHISYAAKIDARFFGHADYVAVASLSSSSSQKQQQQQRNGSRKQKRKDTPKSSSDSQLP